MHLGHLEMLRKSHIIYNLDMQVTLIFCFFLTLEVYFEPLLSSF